MASDVFHFTQVKFMAYWFSLPPPGGDPNVFGAAMARRHLEPLVRDLKAPSAGEVPSALVLDFGGMQSATASYLKRTWLYLHRCSLLGLDLAPVENDPADPIVPLRIHPYVARLNDEVRAEFLLVLEQEHLVCAELVSNRDEEPRGQVLGTLDAALREALTALYRHGAASAGELHAEGTAQGKKISVNAWNNRLTDLLCLHLVERRKEGRNWMYAPTMGGLDHG